MSMLNVTYYYSYVVSSTTIRYLRSPYTSHLMTKYRLVGWGVGTRAMDLPCR